MSYAAEFTTDGDKSSTCEKCHTEFPPGIKLFYMQSVEKRKPGRWLCAQCHDYYLAKPTTHRVPSGRTNDAAVHQQTAEAQRGGMSNPVCAVGGFQQGNTLSGMGMPPPSVIPYHPSQRSRSAGGGFMPAPNWPAAGSSSQSHYATISGPNITIYGQTSLSQPAEISNFLTCLPVSPGYQEAHKSYQNMRDHLARQAYASNGIELVVVKAYLMVRAPGRKAASLVSNIMESIGNVPVHIGAKNLKTIVHITLQPLFVKWSKGLSFTFEEVRLRHKTWEEILPRIIGDDTDAISAFFFPQSGKGKSKSKFNPGRGIEVHLELPYEKYTDAQDHRVHTMAQQPLVQGHSSDLLGPGHLNFQQPEVEYGRASGSQAVQQPDIVDLRSSQPSVALQPSGPVTDGDRSLSITKRKLSISDEPHTPPQKARMLELVVSPEVDVIRAALQAQYPCLNKETSVFSKLNLRPVACLFYIMPLMSLAEILRSPSAPIISNEMIPLSLSLIFNPKGRGKCGGFKKALFGHTSCPVLGPDDNAQICLKQCFYTSKGSKTCHIYDNSRQIRELEAEVKCLKWATALMNLVYDFIDGEQKVRGNPPFNIPQLRFVEAALATAVLEEKGAQTYLVEELIDEKIEGKFVKYISNDRAVPLPLANPESACIAEFLSFVQHVQFHKTKKLAFVSDFQGGRTMLTDPQIITAPDLGSIFAEGNLPAAFKSFPEHHPCNKYCQFFNLPQLESFQPASAASSHRTSSDRQPQAIDDDDHDSISGEGSGVRSMVMGTQSTKAYDVGT